MSNSISPNSSGNPEEIPTGLEEENEYTVDYWRRQFIEIRPKLKRNWHQQLAEYDPTLDSLKGANDMRAVSHGKASLTVTQRIVDIAEKALKPKKPARKEWTLEDSFMRSQKWRQTYWKNREKNDNKDRQ